MAEAFYCDDEAFDRSRTSSFAYKPQFGFTYMSHICINTCLRYYTCEYTTYRNICSEQTHVFSYMQTFTLLRENGEACTLFTELNAFCTGLLIEGSDVGGQYENRCMANSCPLL